MTPLVSINFSMTLQTEILSTVTSEFLKLMIVLKSFNSVLYSKDKISQTNSSSTLKSISYNTTYFND